jgi:hypothetical protein
VRAIVQGGLARSKSFGALYVLTCKRLERRIWKTWRGYYRRSLVDTKMHYFKRLGERVMVRTFEPQVVELHVRVALINRFSQLGRPVIVFMAQQSRLFWPDQIQKGCTRLWLRPITSRQETQIPR